MKKLVLVRHGESVWNQENRFTGWVDVGLSEKGLTEARLAGQLLKREGLEFDEAHSSILKRAIKTLWLALEELDAMWLPTELSWRLNERHYGALQGLNKKETTARYGEDQVFVWRRSYSTPPPAMDAQEFEAQKSLPRLRSVPREDLPKAEALSDCLKRVMPYWNSTLAPRLLQGKTLLVVAHGNSIRALVKHLDNLSEDEIAELNIPTGIPLYYELDENLCPLSRRYLGDPEVAEQAAQAVKNQSK